MSKHCYVIASGPSLLGFNFDALPEGVRIGANRSAWLAKCDILITVDRNFHRQESERIAGFGSNAYVAVNGVHAMLPKVNYWHHISGPGLSFAPGTLTGSNSGFAALNLAVQLGFTDIALLGFDFKWLDTRSHFHEGYGQRGHVQRNLQVWSQAFNHVPAQIADKGITVTNFTGPSGSLVTAFPTAPLADLL
jgi:hypothetical protein